MSKKLLSISNSAFNQLRRIIKKTDFKEFELSLSNGGCSGFKYNEEIVESL